MNLRRFRLRTFLIACVAIGVCSGLFLRWHWQPKVGWQHVRGVTENGTRYQAKPMWQEPAFGEKSLLNVIVVPERTSGYSSSTSALQRKPNGRLDLEVLPTGVFHNGSLIGGHGTSKVLIVLDRRDVRVIELSAGDIQALDAAAGPQVVETRAWKEKVEPQIDRLVRDRLNVHDRHALGLPVIHGND